MFERKDRYLGIGFALLGAFTLLYAMRWKDKFSPDPAGPSALPMILSCFFIVIGVILLAGSLMQNKGKSDEAPIFTREELIMIGSLSAICLVYTIVLPYISYLLATPLFIGSILYVTGVRRPKTLILVSVLTTLALFLVFYYVLQVRLPLGFLRDPLRAIGIAR